MLAWQDALNQCVREGSPASTAMSFFDLSPKIFKSVDLKLCLGQVAPLFVF